MNGIDFMVRALAGWTPSVPPARRRLHWRADKPRPIQPEEIEFIQQAKGRISSYALAECYGVSAQTISNIWAGRRPMCLVPRPSRSKTKGKQP